VLLYGNFPSLHLNNKQKLRKIIIICFTLFAACTQPTKEKKFTFIVSSFNQPIDPKEPPPPAMPEYAPFDFIFDKSGQIYYYQLQIGKPRCASRLDDDLTPPFINLQPENIVQVPVTNIAEFIRSNILALDKDYKYVSIATFDDTVKAISFKTLIDIFSDTASKTTYSVRKITQEENVVLGYKKRLSYYDPNSVIWDSSRIRFPPKMKMPKIEGN
jgi:hypothetical protein